MGIGDNTREGKLGTTQTGFIRYLLFAPQDIEQLPQGQQSKRKEVQSKLYF